MAEKDLDTIVLVIDTIKVSTLIAEMSILGYKAWNHPILPHFKTLSSPRITLQMYDQLNMRYFKFI